MSAAGAGTVGAVAMSGSIWGGGGAVFGGWADGLERVRRDKGRRMKATKIKMINILAITASNSPVRSASEVCNDGDRNIPLAAVRNKPVGASEVGLKNFFGKIIPAILWGVGLT